MGRGKWNERKERKEEEEGSSCLFVLRWWRARTPKATATDKEGTIKLWY
jgi:hypothetical protein